MNGQGYWKTFKSGEAIVPVADRWVTTADDIARAEAELDALAATFRKSAVTA